MGESDSPKPLTLFLMFIDKIGFPLLAFLLMAYLCLSSLSRMAEALEENTRALEVLGMELMIHDKNMAREFKSMGAHEYE